MSKQTSLPNLLSNTKAILADLENINEIKVLEIGSIYDIDTKRHIKLTLAPVRGKRTYLHLWVDTYDNDKFSGKTTVSSFRIKRGFLKDVQSTLDNTHFDELYNMAQPVESV